MSKIPHTFEISANGEYSKALSVHQEGDIVTVDCSQLNMKVCHHVDDEYSLGPDLDDVSTCTPGFVAHSQFGFTLHDYSEFLITDDVYGLSVQFVTLNIGDVEITSGHVSPLAMYLFEPLHDSVVHPEWEYIFSLRLYPLQVEKVETYLLNALTHLRSSHNILFDLVPLSPSPYPLTRYDISRSSVPEKFRLPTAVVDIEPLRLLYSALDQSDLAWSFIQYYRIIEYYSVLSRKTEMSVLRTDNDVGMKEFIKRMTDILRFNDRSNIGRLVAALADADILQEAQDIGVIEILDGTILGEALFAFRNSLVHGKFDYRSSMYAPPLFAEDEDLEQWTNLARTLALRAISTFGTKDI